MKLAKYPFPKYLTFAFAIIAWLAATAIPANAADLPNFTALIKDNAKTVVQIDSRIGSSSTAQLNNGQVTPEEFFRYFFENPNNQPNTPHQGRRSKSHGSGFFIDDQGHILTNAHVVEGAEEIIVSTTNQKEYTAQLIGLDARTDVALLKIDATSTPAATLGDSDQLEVGNWVLAIGSPFGFDYTATAGIVSAVSRSLPDGTYVPFIQTDAAVNPGNSGGPLFNLDGEVIGINSQIYSRTGSFNGLAFAIPINTAVNIAEQLKTKGYVSRGWLGVGIQGIDQELAQSFGLDKPTGALVANVLPDSPAQQAGIQAGDIILTFNGKTIHKSSELPPMVGTVPVGTAVDVTVLRKGKQQTLSISIGELEEDRPKTPVTDRQTQSNQGLTVKSLSERLQSELHIDSGVAVVKVVPASKAAKAGFRAGDVIVNIDNRTIRHVDDFNQAMQAIQKDTDKPAAVLVIRDGRSLFIPL